MNFKVINKEDIPMARNPKGGKYYKLIESIINSGAESVEITGIDAPIISIRPSIEQCIKKYFQGRYKVIERSGRLFVIRKDF